MSSAVLQKMDRLPTVKRVAESSPIPVRLSDETIERLERVAERIGTTRAGVIKLCLKSFLDHFESNGGRSALPVDWPQILSSLDGRTCGSKSPKAPYAPKNAGEAYVLNDDDGKPVSSEVADAARLGASIAMRKVLRKRPKSST